MLGLAWADVGEREKQLGIVPGTPILLSEHQLDGRLNSYFRQAFQRDRMSTAGTYAVELKTWLAFLSGRDVQWDEARPEEVRSFQLWRVYERQNPSRVTPATWNKGWAALRHFYEWAHSQGWVDHNPVGVHDRLRDPSQVGGHREKNARHSRDRWLTPAEFAMWRDVGLRGYAATVDDSGKVVAELPRRAFRGRNIARNSAFVDFVISTGLREAEAGSLLTFEIPARVGDKAPIIGKGGVLRHYSVMHWSGLQSLTDYVDGERRDVIRAAQRSGLYRAISDRLDVVEMLPDGRRGQREIGRAHV